MSNEAKSKLSVAAAFAAAQLAAPAAPAAGPGEQATQTDTEEIQVSPAAMERLEVAAQTALFWWPWPPRWVELWPEVTHVESVKTA